MGLGPLGVSAGGGPLPARKSEGIEGTGLSAPRLLFLTMTAGTGIQERPTAKRLEEELSRLHDGIQFAEPFLRKMARLCRHEGDREMLLEIVATVELLLTQIGKAGLDDLFSRLSDLSPKPRIEANVLVAYCFRNGVLEDFHADGEPLSDAWMKTIMIDASRRADAWTHTRRILTRFDALLWSLFVLTYHRMYCSEWEVRRRGRNQPPRKRHRGGPRRAASPVET